MRDALMIHLGLVLSACTPSGSTAAPEPEPLVAPDEPPSSPPAVEPEPEPTPDPELEPLPAGPDAALPVLHGTDVVRIATLPTGDDTLVVYSFNQLAEHVARRTPELRAEIEAASKELQRECRADRSQLPRDELEDVQRNEPGCEVLAAAGAAGLGDQAAMCEVLALARFDAQGAMVAQSTLSDQPCLTGAAQAQLRDFSGHGSPELVLRANVGSYGPTHLGYGVAESRERLLVFHLQFRREPFVPLLELDLSERDARTANPSVTERRIRLRDRGLELYSAVTDGGCGPNAIVDNDDEADDTADQDGEVEDEDAGEAEDEPCTVFAAQRQRWDHFEGRYTPDKPIKPIKLEPEEIEELMAALPRVP